MTDFRKRRLYRISSEAKLAGVCAGLAEYFDIDVTLVRLVTLASVFAGGFGVFFYIAAALIMPDKKDLNLDPKE